MPTSDERDRLGDVNIVVRAANVTEGRLDHLAGLLHTSAQSIKRLKKGNGRGANNTTLLLLGLCCAYPNEIRQMLAKAKAEIALCDVALKPVDEGLKSAPKKAVKAVRKR